MKTRSQPISSDPIVGLGPISPKIRVYLPHFPNCDHLQTLNDVRPAYSGELHQIGLETGNHWRKIINLSAKLGFAFNRKGYDSWQGYRDAFLCRSESDITLMFGCSELIQGDKAIHIISGHQYCETLASHLAFEAFDVDFRICRNNRVIDCPYFDYRQLSNAKLEVLLELVKTLTISAAP